MLAEGMPIGDGKTVIAVVAGGAVTLLTATVGQLLSERFKRDQEARQQTLERHRRRLDTQLLCLDTLRRTQQALETVLSRDRSLDLVEADDPQAKSVLDADSAFRSAIARVESSDVRSAALNWRRLAKDYAVRRVGEKGGPRLTEVEVARDDLDDKIGQVERAIVAED